MTENELSKIIVDTCYRIHVGLGPGLFESVYEEILTYELVQKDLNVTRQKAIPVIWQDIKMDQGFRADLIVENKVLIEIKSVETIAPVHQKQVLTYLKTIRNKTSVTSSAIFGPKPGSFCFILCNKKIHVAMAMLTFYYRV